MSLVSSMSERESKFALIRKDFPALEQKINGQDLVYLDSGATSLKPFQVVKRISDFYLYESSNVHRGAHFLSDQATRHFEAGREKVKSFLNASTSSEIIFTKGTTESINLVAQAYLLEKLEKGDQILVSEMEHHGNIVPWQMIALKKEASIVSIRVDENGELDFDDYQKKLNERVKLVAITACSNVLGTIVDTKRVTQMAHSVGAKVLIDGAQIVSQRRINVQEINCDFFAFSAHKIFGPFGLGVLFVKREILELMPPYQGGGSMISKVSFTGTTFNDIPYRFEAGTPNIEGVIGLSAALSYVENIGMDDIHLWEDFLLAEATRLLTQIPSLKIYGNSNGKAPIISFNLKGAHHSDVAQIIDKMGVAVRAGHHCAQPLMERLKIPGSVRATFSIYNNLNDIHILIKSILKAQELLL